MLCSKARYFTLVFKWVIKCKFDAVGNPGMYHRVASHPHQGRRNTPNCYRNWRYKITRLSQFQKHEVTRSISTSGGSMGPAPHFWAKLTKSHMLIEKIAEGRKAGRAKKNKNAPPLAQGLDLPLSASPPGWDAGYLPTLSLPLPIFTPECR